MFKVPENDFPDLFTFPLLPPTSQTVKNLINVLVYHHLAFCFFIKCLNSF